MSDTRKRVALVVNKWWELDPIIAVVLNGQARPAKVGWPHILEHPRPRPSDRALPVGLPHVRPRAIWTLRNVIVEAWCISDLLECLPESSAYQSSSQRKVEALPLFLAGRAPELVVAAGTAAWPDPDAAPSRNGCVVIGQRCFLHNFHPSGSNPASRWDDGPFDKILESNLAPELFVRATTIDAAEVGKRFLRTPLNPGTPELLVDASAVSLGTVNVTDYREYDAADRATLDAWRTHGDGASAVSVETTHGLIRVLAGKTPFLFASGIANRVLRFGQEVSPAEYAQDFAAAHNLGVVIAWMLPELDAALV